MCKISTSAHHVSAGSRSGTAASTATASTVILLCSRCRSSCGCCLLFLKTFCFFCLRLKICKKVRIICNLILNPPRRSRLTRTVARIPVTIPAPYPFFFFCSIVCPFRCYLKKRTKQNLPLCPPLFFESLSCKYERKILNPFVLHIIIWIHWCSVKLHLEM